MGRASAEWAGWCGGVTVPLPEALPTVLEVAVVVRVRLDEGGGGGGDCEDRAPMLLWRRCWVGVSSRVCVSDASELLLLSSSRALRLFDMAVAFCTRGVGVRRVEEEWECACARFATRRNRLIEGGRNAGGLGVSQEEVCRGKRVAESGRRAEEWWSLAETRRGCPGMLAVEMKMSG